MLKKLALMSVLLISGFGQAEASHLMGVDLTYQCINNCTIRVHLKAYRDCTGSSFISPNPFQFTPQTSGCTAPTPITSWSTQQTTEVTPVCGTTSTRCTNSSASINGVEEFYWWRDYNICTAGNCIFNLEWSTCCRNPAITSGASNQSIYVGATTLNNTLSSCNNTPVFANPPVPYICAGQPYTFNQGAIDPDGDSLSYSLGPCYQNSSSNPVSYNTGYSQTQPLGSSWNVSIDPSTGDITVTPNPGNQVVGVMCVYVTEYRNGVAINSIVRDIQMTVIPCPSNNLPTTTGVQNLNGGVINNPFDVTVCMGSQISFQLPSNDPNSGQTLKVFWNQNIPGATFTELGNSSVQDTITGTNPTSVFTWTPNAMGQYSFLITLQDDACPIIGQNQYTIKIDVIGGLVGATATWSPAGCTDVSFSANPGSAGTGPYTYQWSGSGNLNLNSNNNQQNFNHTYPGPGQYWYQCVMTDAFGCTETIIDTVTINNGPTADAGPDISLCSGFTTTIGTPAISGQSYSWVGPSISPSNAAQPTVNHSNSGPGPDTLNYTLVASDNAGCSSIDYVTVVVYPVPTAGISGNMTICDGDSTTLTASGGSSVLWSTGDTTTSIKVSPPQATTYTVTVINNGCASQPAQATVNVNQGPIALISGTNSVCPGDNANLTVVGGNNWQWSTGSQLQTINIGPINQDTTVSVVASQGACSGPPSSFTVTVDEVPVADFTAPEVCDEQTMSFSDQSTISSGGVSGWSWNFGDPSSGLSNTSVSQNPAHTFTGSGTYQVTLTVTSDKGCQHTTTETVRVNSLPSPDFTFDNVCEGETMNFTDITMGNIQSYTWDFGDGSGDTSRNTSHAYASPDAYNVILRVVDDNGCVNEAERTVFTHPNPEADFEYRLKCFNTIAEFTNTSRLNDPFGTEIQAWSWNFGDPGSGSDNTASIPNPTHTYQVGQDYTVTYQVTTSQGCTNTITETLNPEEVPLPVVEPDTVCAGFGGVLSAERVWANSTVEWYTVETGGEPFHTGRRFFTPPVAGSKIFWVGLQDVDGCRSARVPVEVYAHRNPRPSFTVNDQTMEIPNAIAEFTWTGNTIVPPVVFAWTFGDGSGSSQENPVHEYTEPGEYTVSLTVIDENGCEATSTAKNYIMVDQNIRLYIPNAFSPNGDGVNDEFFIQTKLVTDFNIQVFDRWGRLVFESGDQNFRWKGMDPGGQELPEGVYVWSIQARGYDGYKIEKSGSITLIR